MGGSATVDEVEGPPRAGVGRGCTFASSLDLPAAEQRVIDQVWQPAVQVHGGQTALEAFPGSHQLGQVAIHAGSKASNVQVSWKSGGMNVHP